MASTVRASHGFAASRRASSGVAVGGVRRWLGSSSHMRTSCAPSDGLGPRTIIASGSRRKRSMAVTVTASGLASACTRASRVFSSMSRTMRSTSARNPVAGRSSELRKESHAAPRACERSLEVGGRSSSDCRALPRIVHSWRALAAGNSVRRTRAEVSPNVATLGTNARRASPASCSRRSRRPPSPSSVMQLASRCSTKASVACWLGHCSTTSTSQGASLSSVSRSIQTMPLGATRCCAAASGSGSTLVAIQPPRSFLAMASTCSAVPGTRRATTVLSGRK